MIFNKPIDEIIKQRTSIRNYENSPIRQDIRNKISSYAENLKGPFNSKLRCKIVDANLLNKDEGIKLGTYGMVKGASTFLITAVEKSEDSLVDLGYAFEELVLYSVSLGLDTCWLGGTFNKGEFAKAVNLKENEVLPIVSPIGYGSGKKSFLEKIMKAASGKKPRRDFQELFFNEDFANPLEKTNDNYSNALEMVRLAPSAVNKQPWRILKKDDEFYFYLINPSKKEIDIHEVDLGIAMCHFNLYLNEKGIKGHFVKKASNENDVPENYKCIAVWTRDN